MAAPHLPLVSGAAAASVQQEAAAEQHYCPGGRLNHQSEPMPYLSEGGGVSFFSIIIILLFWGCELWGLLFCVATSDPVLITPLIVTALSCLEGINRRRRPRTSDDTDLKPPEEAVHHRARDRGRSAAIACTIH